MNMKLVKAWYEESKQSGKSGFLSFNGNQLFSYDMLLATKHNDGYVLLKCGDFSKTKMRQQSDAIYRHKGLIYQIVPSRFVFDVPHVDGNPHEKNILSYVEIIESLRNPVSITLYSKAMERYKSAFNINKKYV